MREIMIDKTKAKKSFFHLELKSKDSSNRIIRGYASTRFVDRDYEIVDPAAFKDAMDVYMANPIVLRDHDRTKPIGKCLSYNLTRDGLWVEDQIGEGTEDCDETWALIEQDILKAFSIGFRPISVNWNGENPVIEKLELAEHSVVSIPCNRESLFSVAKAFKDGSDLIDLPQKLIGFQKTIAELNGVIGVIEKNYDSLPEIDRIAIDAMAVRLQNVLKTNINYFEEDALLSEIELLKEIVSLR